MVKRGVGARLKCPLFGAVPSDVVDPLIGASSCLRKSSGRSGAAFQGLRASVLTRCQIGLMVDTLSASEAAWMDAGRGSAEPTPQSRPWAASGTAIL